MKRGIYIARFRLQIHYCILLDLVEMTMTSIKQFDCILLVIRQRDKKRVDALGCTQLFGLLHKQIMLMAPIAVQFALMNYGHQDKEQHI